MTTQIITFEYDNTPVFFQPDAFINATQIATSFGKKVKDYLKTDRTIEYLSALVKRLNFDAEAKGIKILFDENQLVIVKKGAPETGGGTWLHPKLAIDFARWLSADFAIWCDLQIEKILHPVQYGLKRLPEPPSITKAQAGILYNKVAAIAGSDNKIRSAIWKRFQNHFALSSYKDLPADKYDEALAYLETKQEEYRQGVEMLYVSTKELDLLVRERLVTLSSPVKEGEVLPKEAAAALPTLTEKDWAWLYCVWEETQLVIKDLKPLQELHSISLINLPKYINNLQVGVTYLHQQFGETMAAAAKNQGLFDRKNWQPVFDEGMMKQAPTQHNSVTLTLKPLAKDEFIKRWMVTQIGDNMVQLWDVGSPEHAMQAWRDEGYIIIKKDEVSARKLADEYLPYQMLAPLIVAAGQRLQRIEGGRKTDK